MAISFHCKDVRLFSPSISHTILQHKSRQRKRPSLHHSYTNSQGLFNNQLLYIINHFIENFTLSYLISYLSTIQPDYNTPLYFATRVHHINILEFAEATRSLHYPTHIITLLFSLSPHSTSSSPYPISHIIPQRQPLIARFPHHHLQNINNLSQTQRKIFSAPVPPILTSPNAIDSHSAAQILFIEPSRVEFGNIMYSVKFPQALQR